MDAKEKMCEADMEKKVCRQGSISLNPWRALLVQRVWVMQDLAYMTKTIFKLLVKSSGLDFSSLVIFSCSTLLFGLMGKNPPKKRSESLREAIDS